MSKTGANFISYLDGKYPGCTADVKCEEVEQAIKELSKQPVEVKGLALLKFRKQYHSKPVEMMKVRVRATGSTAALESQGQTAKEILSTAFGAYGACELEQFDIKGVGADVQFDAVLCYYEQADVAGLLGFPVQIGGHAVTVQEVA